MKNNTPRKTLLLIAVLTIIVSVGLAMVTQVIETPSLTKGKPLFKTSVGPESDNNDNKARSFDDPPDTVPEDSIPNLVPEGNRAPLWNIEVLGTDTTFPNDTISFSFDIIGQDSALSTNFDLHWDDSKTLLQKISGDTSTTKDILEDDTSTLSYVYLCTDTGRVNLWLLGANDSASTYTMRNNVGIKNLYVWAHGDSTGCVDSITVTTDTFPTGYLAFDTVPDTFYDDTAASFMARVTMSGTVYYNHKHTDEWGNPPGNKTVDSVKVVASWWNWSGYHSTSDWTDENGEYSLKIPSNSNKQFSFKVKARNDAARIGSGDIFNEYEYIHFEKIAGGTTSKNIYVIDDHSEKAWLLNTAHYARKFCHENFGWTPGDRVKIKYPHGPVNKLPYYNCLGEFIRIPSDDHIWGLSNRIGICHEFGHYVDDKEFAVTWDHGPYGHDNRFGSDHDWDDRSGRRVAYLEGWAEFFGGAVAYDYYNLTEEKTYYKSIDKFESNGGDPFWTDDGPNSGLPAESTWTDGRHVEGAIAQFLWDIFDGPEENPDYFGGFDDDDLDRKIGDLWEVYTGYWDGPVFIHPQRVNSFKSGWDDEMSKNIDELYYVVVHPPNPHFGDPLEGNYPVDPPTAFTATWNEDTDLIGLAWNEPPVTDNIGHYMLFFADEVDDEKTEIEYLNDWQSYVGEPYEWLAGSETSDTDEDNGPFERGALYLYMIQGRDNDTSYMDTCAIDTCRVPFITITPDMIADVIPLEIA